MNEGQSGQEHLQGYRLKRADGKGDRLSATAQGPTRNVLWSGGMQCGRRR